MKTLLKVTTASGLIALLALACMEYVRFYNIHSKDDLIGEALDPLNIIAVLCLYGFGILTAILLLACIVGAVYRSVERRRLAANAPDQN